MIVRAHGIVRCVSVVVLIALPSPSLAVRGIDAQHVDRPLKSCSEVLREEIAKGRRPGVRLDDGRKIEHEFLALEGDSLIVASREGSDLTKFALSSVNGVTVRRHRIKPLWMVGGAVGGAVLGGAIMSNRFHDDEYIRVVITIVGIVGGTAGGLVLGTVVPLLIPTEVKIDCR